jgi:hypothetical protein
MTEFDDQFPPIDPLANTHENAYADLGEEVGKWAHMLLEDLAEPLLESQRDELGWYSPEGDALSTLVSMEVVLPHIRATSEISPGEMEVFNTQITTFHLALPLTEAERRWLREQTAIGAESRHFEDTLVHAGDDEVIAEGRRVHLDGHDMLRRWRSWRREAAEYAGQGTLDLAREAVRSMVELLLPWEPLPESYRKLRGLPDTPHETTD